MKILAFLSFILFIICNHAEAISPRHLKRANTGVTSFDFYINNADQTPVTTAQRAALISSTSLVAGNFIAISFTQDEIALTTSTYSCTFDGTTFVGDVQLEQVANILTNKEFMRDWAFETDIVRMLTRQNSGFADAQTLKEIQDYKSHTVFLRRVYITLP